MDYPTGREKEAQLRVLLRSHVERCLQDIWDTRFLGVDEDGDYPFRHGTAMCWVSPVGGPVPGVRVLAQAAFGLKSSARLLREVNELNASSRWVSVSFQNGAVQVRSELAWSAVDRLALRQALRAVGTVADEIGVMLAAVYGGRTPWPPEGIEQGQDMDEEAA